MEGDLQRTFGRNVRAHREKHGFSQEAFADVVGVHRTYWGGVERAERNLTLRSVEHIANVLKVEPVELFDSGWVATQSLQAGDEKRLWWAAFREPGRGSREPTTDPLRSRRCGKRVRLGGAPWLVGLVRCRPLTSGCRYETCRCHTKADSRT